MATLLAEIGPLIDLLERISTRSMPTTLTIREFIFVLGAASKPHG